MIDETDRRLLALLDVHPTIPFAALAERLELSTRTVARRFQSLQSRGLVRVVGRTRPDFGGQGAWLVRVRTAPARTARIATALAGQERTRWVRSTRDGGELIYGLISPDYSTDEVLHRLPDLPGVLATTPFELLTTWPLHSASATAAPAEVDATDRRIISVLGRDGRTTNREIARRVRLHETTVARRRARLESLGVLYYEADVPQSALGRSVDAVLWMDVAPGHILAVGDQLQSLPECRFVAATAGPTTMVANIAAESYAALLTLIDTKLAIGVNRLEIITLGTVYKRLA